MAITVLSNQDYNSASRIINLPPAVASGQPATFDQIASSDPYAGGLYAAVYPSNTVNVTTLGVATTTTGTASTPSLVATSLREMARRTNFATATTAGSLAGLRSGQALCWRGTATGQGGFRLRCAFAISALVTGNRGFVGLWDATAAPTNIDPLTSTANSKIGVGFNSDTGNLQLISNLAGSAPTVIDLGANFAINTTDVWTLDIKCLENASDIDWAVTKAGSSAAASGNLNTNIPPSNGFLSPQIWISNNAQAASAAISLMRWVLTSKNG